MCPPSAYHTTRSSWVWGELLEPCGSACLATDACCRERVDQPSAECSVLMKTCVQTQASSLDDSLSNICKLESAAEGGGKIAVPFKEQNEGREKLQVRDATGGLSNRHRANPVDVESVRRFPPLIRTVPEFHDSGNRGKRAINFYPMGPSGVNLSFSVHFLAD